MSIKKKPIRKCIACRKHGEKSEFLRLVRLSNGEIELDFTGKKNGRGAYICKDIKCLEKAKKDNSLQRSFKCKIDEKTFEEIKLEIESVKED